MDICAPEKKQVEKNKQMNANGVPDKRNPHFSSTVELKKGDEGCLEGLRQRVEHAKSLLAITQKTSMQNCRSLAILNSCRRQQSVQGHLR